MRGILIRAAFALALSTGVAGAATLSFEAPGPNVASIERDGATITPWAADARPGKARISQTKQGLGVVGHHDWQPREIDSAFGDEGLHVAFDEAVMLERFTLGRFGWNVLGGDDFDLYLDGVRAGSHGFGEGDTFDVGRIVSAFAVVARWDYFEDGLSADGFTLRSFEATALPAPVPVPAAGALLLTGLGAFGWLRRRG